MIGFFRKIRKQFADDNKPMKYLRYAIGEIILVMVGILLALQVNNWNELRKKEEAEIQMYHKIIADLNSENTIIELKIRDLSAHQNLYFQLYDDSKGIAKYNPTIFYNLLYTNSVAEMFFNENHSKSLSNITDDETHNLLKKYIEQEKRTTNGNNQWNEIKTENSWIVFKVMSEFVMGLEKLAKIGPCVSIFGSARTKEEEPNYKTAVDIAAKLVRS